MWKGWNSCRGSGKERKRSKGRRSDRVWKGRKKGEVERGRVLR